MSRTHYEILGVRQSDTDATIRRVAKVALDQLNADTSLSSLERDAKLAQLKAATNVLTSAASRDRYDASLMASRAPKTGTASGLLAMPLTWVALCVIGAVGGGLYWQYDREQTRQRLERERVVAAQQEERRFQEVEAKRVAEKQRLLDELRAQREVDDKLRQESNQIRSADIQNKQYVVDERNAPRQTPSYSSSSNYGSSRGSYEDRWQMANDAQRHVMEENRQRYEEAANLQRAKAEVDRQKRYLEQLERDDQNARARREANSRPSR
ncbi:MAG: hypothetical protein ABI583_02185 [Betaproteobacteria bacterium]